jgi:hypothetical protein
MGFRGAAVDRFVVLTKTSGGRRGLSGAVTLAEFVNPYTFVPLVTDPERSAPAGHAVMAPGRLSGSLKVRLTARTPLLIGGYGSDEVPDVPRRADGSPGTPMVPGSGLMGAVRSVHEALAGGCMRVLDSEWAPVHRHPASGAETADLRLAIVTGVDDKGGATKIGLCAEPVVWVNQEILPGMRSRLRKCGWSQG